MRVGVHPVRRELHCAASAVSGEFRETGASIRVGVACDVAPVEAEHIEDVEPDGYLADKLRIRTTVLRPSPL